MKTLLGIRIIFSILIICFGFFIYNSVTELQYKTDKIYGIEKKIQENKDEIRNLKRKLYDYEFIQAENILRKSKKYWSGEVVFLDVRNGEVVLQLNDFRYSIDIEKQIITSY